MAEQFQKFAKEKLAAALGSASGATGVLGSYQVCHQACMSLVTLLGIFGIAVAGMPLLFLTKVAVPFWVAAALLLAATVTLYAKNRCVSPKIITFNAGLVIAGVPFQQVQTVSWFFWSVGGAVAVGSLALIVKDRIHPARGKGGKDAGA